MTAVKNITYTEAITEIENIIAKMDSGELSIDDLETEVKRVLELIKFCKKKLKSSEDLIQKEISVS